MRRLALLVLCAPLAGRCAGVTVSVRVAQAGAFAGVRNTLFTTWLPPGHAVAGLSGRVTLAGNAPGFSEALVLLGYAGDDQAGCARTNNTVITGMPTVSRVWAVILKANDDQPVSLPVSVALRAPVTPPHPQAGACLTTLVSAGYPFLSRDRPLYTTTEVALTVATVPPSRKVLALGVGGEFRFAAGSPAPRATYVGIKANRALSLDAIAGSVSAAPVSGAPVQAHWGVVQGQWRVGTDFVVVPAPACAAANFQGHPVNDAFSILRLAKPAEVAPPSGSVTVARLPLAGRDMAAVQSAGFKDFAPAKPTRLNPGDCLIAFEGPAPGYASGELDVENQSTIYVGDTSR